MLALRGSHNTNPVLLQSRPLLELQFNFSTVNNNNIDLSHNCFRLSKTAMAVQQMDRTIGEVEEEYDQYYNGGSAHGDGGGSGGPTVSMSTRDFKHTIRSSLQSIQEEDYYLVRYRDYSSWATQRYHRLAKSDSYFGRKYVEQCFAVHVGREPGELLVITEEQFLFGIDILQRQQLKQVLHLPGGPSAARHGGGKQNAQNYFQNQLDIDYCALNADQYRSLGAVLGDGMRQVLVEGEELKQKAEAEARRRSTGAPDGYVAPAWWDWSPAAVRARVQHQLSYYYQSIGKLAVQLIVVGCFAYVGYSYVRGLLPAAAESHSGRRGDRRGRGGGRARGGYDDDDPPYRRTLFRSLMFGPKEVFDYLLAPADQ
ncbi:hypothetical protein STCU_09755 [Strigomonas culicis]|uniref:Uncharacterized protein n=1 Tax=Strigomonas culicis TaxID=28005 RepID=S9TQ95_9TRYP|nr:hypothetical protein STCU_09755 [Strigomonas culicis]|eukprot:EPY18824.1 hypothetical protein STCU_09755 [Strigomonas culicis]